MFTTHLHARPAASARWIFAALVVGIVTVGCQLGCARRGGPNGAIASYRRALDRSDYGVAYRMMSSAYRARVTENEYVELMKTSPADVAATVKELGGTYSISERATFRYGTGDALELVLEDGQWRLAHDPSQLYDQSSPYAAVRSFARAYRFAKWDVMLRLVPLPYRTAMTVEAIAKQFTETRKAEFEAMVELLEAAPIDSVVLNGAEASIALSNSGVVRLVRESDGRWCIRDIQ